MTFYKKQPNLKNELKIIVRFYRIPTLLNGRMALTAESETTQVIFFFVSHVQGSVSALRWDHRDKTRVQMPAKIFPHLKVKC